VGAVGIGIGSGVGGMNVLDAFSCSNADTTDTTTFEGRLSALLATLAQNPKDITTLQAVASLYIDNEDFANAARYLEQAIAADPTQRDIYFRLASIYTSSLYDYNSAVALLNKAQAQFPNDPEVYLQLGLAQRSLGNTSAAIMAWQKYLALAPDGSQAQTIRDEIATMSANATTTTTSATTSTTAAPTTATTAPAATSTTAAATSTTAASTTTTAN
jgi:cytochrome c-type biogenesis protein CcmH/NrfG